MKQLKARVFEFERRALIRILRRVRGSMTDAARLTGYDRAYLYRLLEKHGIKASYFKGAYTPPASASPSRQWFGVPLK